jgi:hypothetical protein
MRRWLLPFGPGCYDPHPDPYFLSGREAVLLSDIILRSVTFIGVKKGGKFQPRATGFFVTYFDGQHRFDHLVTAEHVISGLLSKGHEIWVRLNLTGGQVREVRIDAQAFRFHPENAKEPTDVAVSPFNAVFTDFETRKMLIAETSPLAVNGDQSFMPSEDFVRDSIKLGGEVAVIGLFRSHFGTNRNVPILRVGNISTLLGEPVFTKYAGYISAYLIEARSIAGLSGSPVFVVPEPTTLIAKGMIGGVGNLEHTSKSMGQGMALLGLMHGHFDIPNLNEDVVADDDAPHQGVHTGIGVVVPAQKILETIEHPELVQMRKALIAQLRQGGATSDLAPETRVSEAPSVDDDTPAATNDI